MKFESSSSSPPVPAITTRLSVRSSTLNVFAWPPAFISTAALNVDTPATTSSSRSVCPSTSSPASMSTAALNVDTPETTWSPAAYVAIPMKVDTPLIFKSVNVFGATSIAASIVAVVVASKEAIFWSSLPLLITCVAPILRDATLVIPETFNPLKISTAALISISFEKVAMPTTFNCSAKFAFFPTAKPPLTITAPVTVDSDWVLPENDTIPTEFVPPVNSYPSVESRVRLMKNLLSVASQINKLPSVWDVESTSVRLSNLDGGAEALDNTRITFCDPILSFMLGIT